MSNIQTESSNKFIKRLFGFSIGPIINVLIGFVSVPLTTWFLFPEELGKAAMFNTATMVISSIIFLGLTNSLSREYITEDNKPLLLLNCIIIPFTISIIIALIAFIFRKEISTLLFDGYFLTPVIIFCISLPIMVIDGFSSSLIRMEEKARLFSYHQVLKKVSSFSILLFVFICIEKTYYAVIFASLGSLLITSVSQIFFMKSIWKNIFKEKIDITLLKKLLSFGLPFVPAAVLAWLFNSIDKMALRAFSDFTEIGFYSGAFKVVALLNIIKTSFSSFWSPTSYRWHANNEKIDKYQKVSDSLMSIFVAFAAFAIVFRRVIFLLLSEKYLPSASVFPFLMFIPILHTVSQTTSMGIQFKRKTHYQIYAFLIASIINVTGNLILVPRYGAVGASISTGVSYIIFFYIRSIFSSMLWEKIKMNRHTVNIILLSILSTLAILKEQIILIEIVVTIILLLYNLKNIIFIAKVLLKSILKRKK